MNVLIEGRSYLLVVKYPKNRRIWYVKQMKKKTTFLLVEILVLKLSLHKSSGEMPFRLHFGFVRLFKMHFRLKELKDMHIKAPPLECLDSGTLISSYQASTPS